MSMLDPLLRLLLSNALAAAALALVATLRFLAGIRVPATVGAVGMADLSEIQRRLEMIMTTLPRRRSPVARLALGAAILATLAFAPLAASRADIRPGDDQASTALDRPITTNLEHADPLDVLTSFAELTGYELKITPDVKGTVSVDATGRVQDVVVLKSPDNRLSEPAMTAVRGWVFTPAMKDGVPVAVRYMVTVRFALQ